MERHKRSGKPGSPFPLKHPWNSVFPLGKWLSGGSGPAGRLAGTLGWMPKVLHPSRWKKLGIVMGLALPVGSPWRGRVNGADPSCWRRESQSGSSSFSQTFGFLIPSQAGFPAIFVASPFPSPPEAEKQGQHHFGGFSCVGFPGRLWIMGLHFRGVREEDLDKEVLILK